MPISDKKLKGQFYTKQNPFVGDLFTAWYELIPKNTRFLEPFAGSGSLFNFIEADWVGYDIEPNHPNVQYRDTLASFPTGFDVCITNPPYLAQTVISRLNLPVNLTHQDLYLDCLEKVLENCGYVAAIIPSSFYNQPILKDRLFAWDKLDYKMFDDTDAPVGVAYFTPAVGSVPLLGVNGQLMTFDGTDIPFSCRSSIRFNPSDPTHTLIAIDSLEDNNIHIREYRGEPIKNTNRHIVPLNGLPCSVEVLNSLIDRWRTTTKDFFLTSFMSCMESGKYRKRLLFNQLHWLANLALTHKENKIKQPELIT